MVVLGAAAAAAAAMTATIATTTTAVIGDCKTITTAAARLDNIRSHRQAPLGQRSGARRTSHPVVAFSRGCCGFGWSLSGE
jgi:hypothetical protein